MANRDFDNLFDNTPVNASRSIEEIGLFIKEALVPNGESPSDEASNDKLGANAEAAGKPALNMSDKCYFVEYLRSTCRKGVDDVLANLDRLGFFKAPASTAFHLNCEGGLLKHSVNVCREALALREKQIELCPECGPLLPEDSVIIASLLHDVCKAEIYKAEEKNRKGADGRWEKYMGYGVDYSDLPVGHGEKSVIRLLQWGLQLNDEEILAIRWHMQAWDLGFQSPEMKSNLGAAKDKTPLVALISAADGLASFILESRR